MKKLTKYEINAIAKKVWDQISKKIASRLNTLGGEKLQQLKEQCSNDFLEYQKARQKYNETVNNLYKLIDGIKGEVIKDKRFETSLVFGADGELSIMYNYGVLCEIVNDLTLKNINPELRVYDLIEQLVDKYSK